MYNNTQSVDWKINYSALLKVQKTLFFMCFEMMPIFGRY